MTMRTLTVLLLAGSMFSTGCSRSAPASAAAAQSSPEQSTSSIAKDHDRLQGTWKMDRAILNGQVMISEVRWVFDGDHVMVVLGGNTSGMQSEFQLGTGDSPNTILLKLFNNPLASQGFAGGSFTGIYKLSGDKLRVCYDMTGLQYPKNFDAGKGTRRISYEFTREKTAQHAAAE